MTLTIDESAILDAFFDDVTQGGSLPFTWTHPRTGVAVQCQFAPGTQLLYEDEEGGEVITQFTIEVLP